MTTSIKDSLAVHSQALLLRGQRNNLIASNIANAATPGYKARDFDFATEMTKAVGAGELRVSNARHMATTSGNTGVELGYRQSTMPSLDGNTVEMSVEQMEFAENTVRYQASLEFLNRRISGLMSVIRGE
ncbi:flagellar basal body rod protein FlgB [Marivivens sp. LCG002]|uniref:flagellar basal body rod protein FlgB n=1 Tax=Marivivens sp. LCG002 TaxID=3051171 RepID=UPI002554E7EF|nr:flagellar basal body rod protein FlgB [Marivivens sp. LCG002]WIV51260.1 flagellar basal body rod protein FlgB [Marivivens sp. LCG002]